MSLTAIVGEIGWLGRYYPKKKHARKFEPIDEKIPSDRSSEISYKYSWENRHCFLSPESIEHVADLMSITIYRYIWKMLTSLK